MPIITVLNKVPTFYKEPVLLAVLDKEKVSTGTLASSVPDPTVKFLSLPDL